MREQQNASQRTISGQCIEAAEVTNANTRPHGAGHYTQMSYKKMLLVSLPAPVLALWQC
jgi:hypothetical protein